VKKVVPSTGEVTIFVYDAASKLIGEYATIVASVEDAKLAYLTADHLGSPRVLTDENGATISRRDFHPFGEEIATPQRTESLGYMNDTVRQKFTGYERDDESGLDYAQARYYANQRGRFTGVDAGPFTPADPQNFNRYAYVQNNPLKFRDPSGNRIELTGDEAQAFIDYLEKKTGLKLKYKTKNGVTIITGSSKDKTFTGTVNKEFAKIVSKVAAASEVAKFNVDSSIAKNGNDQGEVVFFDDGKAAWDSRVTDKSGNTVIRPVNVNMRSINSVDGQYSEFAQALVGHFLIEGLEMRKIGANYDLGTEGGAHQTGLDVEKDILGQKDKRYENISGGNSQPSTNATISFVYTSVQYDVIIKNDGSAVVNKISPPAIQRPKN
jgi:RHS repeat-associated protein